MNAHRFAADLADPSKVGADETRPELVDWKVRKSSALRTALFLCGDWAHSNRDFRSAVLVRETWVEGLPPPSIQSVRDASFRQTNNDGRGNKRNSPKFQTDLVLSPRPPLASIRSHQHSGVVNDGRHSDGRHTGPRAGPRAFPRVRICSRTRRRAASISSSVAGPYCFSHSATAANPARRLSVSRAAKDNR